MNDKLAAIEQHLDEVFTCLSHVNHAVVDAAFPFEVIVCAISNPTVLLDLIEKSRHQLQRLAGIVALVKRGEPCHVSSYGGEEAQLL